jgi:GTPase SAR1 family protein
MKIIIVFDVTDQKSFDDVEKWFDEIRKYEPNVNIVLVGNKNDLNEKRKVSFEDSKKLADKLQIPYFETSAKEGVGVNETFYKLVEIYSKYDQTSIQNNKTEEGLCIIS